jgi:hypothetical protein
VHGNTGQFSQLIFLFVVYEFQFSIHLEFPLALWFLALALGFLALALRQTSYDMFDTKS